MREEERKIQKYERKQNENLWKYKSNTGKIKERHYEKGKKKMMK